MSFVMKSFEECVEKVSYGNKIQRTEYLSEGKYPVVSQESKLINGFWNNEADVFTVDKPVIVFGDHTRALKFIDFSFVLGADGAKIIKPKSFVDTKFFYYFLQANPLGAKGYARHYRFLKELALIVPPLATQQKIVAKLDAIFAEIDKATAAAETNAKNAEALFRSYLRCAFNTENFVKLSSITKEITDGDHQPPPKAEDGVPFITISNVNKVTREIDFSRTFKVSKDYFNSLKHNRKPRLGDVLYTVTGSFGIPIHVNKDIDFCFQRHIGLIRPSEGTDSRWLFWLMLSPQIFQQAIDSATGAAQLTVSLKAIRNFNVPFMLFDEQKKIVTRLDTCFSHVRKLQNSYTQKVQELNAHKQAILKQAFNGELVKD